MSGTDDRVADETSPLVGPNRTDDDDVVDSITVSQRHHGVPPGDHSGNFAETKSSWYLFLLTLCIVGYVRHHISGVPSLFSRRDDIDVMV
jgi:solute carrier family 45 protein 1/2/4